LAPLPLVTHVRQLDGDHFSQLRLAIVRDAKLRAVPLHAQPEVIFRELEDVSHGGSLADGKAGFPGPVAALIEATPPLSRGRSASSHIRGAPPRAPRVRTRTDRHPSAAGGLPHHHPATPSQFGGGPHHLTSTRWSHRS